MLDTLFNPRGVAVVGSMSQGKLGFELFRQIVDGGYHNVWAVNPKAQGALNTPGYSAIQNIPHIIDLAVIASPADSVPEVLSDCHRARVCAAVVISSGFSEIGNFAGEQTIRSLSKEYGIRIVGPNCAGITSSSSSLFATLETRPPSGQMALISQSGALGGAVLSWAEEQGVGISKFISYGNRVDLDELDILPYLANDADTKVVALYVESVPDGRRFMQVVREFCKTKPLVVIKSGRSQAGLRAALSHTGSMAGSDEVYDCALKQCGALRVETIEEMFDLCKGFTMMRPPQGKRVIVVTNSGGPGILTADRAERAGLEVSEPSEHLKRIIYQHLGKNCGVGNPIDLTVQGNEAGFQLAIREALLEYDCAIALNVATPYLDSISLARGISEAARMSGKPVAASFMAGRLVHESIDYLQKHEVPNFFTGERGADVLARMAEYASREVINPVDESEIEEKKSRVNSDRMNEPEAMRWLAENGFPIPKFRFVQNKDEIAGACREIGFPVVMKVVSPNILHKSDVGGVVLQISSTAEAEKAFSQMIELAAGKTFLGVVIYPQIQKAHEMILGLYRDAQFGPVVIAGLGGIYTEVLRDISMRVAPISPVEAQQMLKELQSFSILVGVRGQHKCDLEKLSRLMSQFSYLPFQYTQIVEIDLNPLFILDDDICIGDARVILEKGAEHG